MTISSPRKLEIIEHAATEEIRLGGLQHFRRIADTHRLLLQLGAEHHRQATPGSNPSDRTSLIPGRLHQRNLSSLALL